MLSTLSIKLFSLLENNRRNIVSGISVITLNICPKEFGRQFPMGHTFQYVLHSGVKNALLFWTTFSKRFAQHNGIGI